VLQHAAIHALLGWTFAITLRGGATPLITALAERVHAQPLSAGERAYTRRADPAWVGFFVGMIGVSLALYALAPWSWWSFFCTVLTPARRWPASRSNSPGGAGATPNSSRSPCSAPCRPGASTAAATPE
jgi:hypothetical protein